jgi:thioredoxin-related protein
MIKIAIGLLITSQLLFSSGIEWKSWSDALALSKKKHKIIMIEAVRDGCHYCEDMQRDVFSDKRMSDFIQKRFIGVRINIAHQKMPLDIEVSMTPTFYFISEDKKIIKVVPGSWNREDFKNMLEEIK